MTLWILGGAALVTLAAAACGSADEQPSESTGSSHTLQRTLQAIGEIPPEYVPVPGGVLMHRDCVHEVPDGADVAADLTVSLRGAKIAEYSRCAHQVYRLVARADRGATPQPPPAFTGGWVENSRSSGPTQAMYTHMDSGTWVVPSAPASNDGQLIYLYPSLTSKNWIVQPVLQWTAGSWGINNWAVMGNGTVNAFHGTLASVNVGDHLSGVMNISFRTANSQTWQVGWTDITKGTTATNTFGLAESNAFIVAEAGVLEAWYIKNCNDFPASGFTAFGSPSLYQGNDYNGRSLISPTWMALTWDNDLWDGPVCNFGINVFSDGTTQLYY